MKRIVITSLFAGALFGAQAQSFTDNARVRSAEPQYENISVPRNECSRHWVPDNGGRVNTQRQSSQDRQFGGAIVGGLAGGILGRQVGGGSGRDAATALGVVLGAIAGDQLQNRDARSPYDNGQYSNTQYGNNQYGTNQYGNDQYGNNQYGNVGYETAQREVQRCRTVYDAQTRITGYRVSYDYRGQNYTTFMRSNPGSSLPVRVTVEPITQ